MITLFCIRPKGFNVGNDAIHAGVRALLHEAFGRIVNIVSLPATSIYESRAKAGLTSQTIHDMNRLADGVIVGGGNLYENGELAVALSAVRSLEPPLLLFSLSRGRVYNRQLQLVERTDVMPRQTIEVLHEKARYSVARDEPTQNYLQSIGCSHAVLGGCPTIQLARVASELPSLPEGERAGALISIRSPALMNIPNVLQSRVAGHIEATIDALRARGVRRIRLLCHDLRDVEFATVFQSTRQVDYVYADDVHWFLSLLRSAELVVSYRLHATLPSLSYGTPVISISYDERATSLFRLCGMDKWDINMVEEPDVAKAVLNRLDRLPELKTIREERREQWDGLWNIQATEVKRFARDVGEYARNAHARYAGAQVIAAE